MRRERNPQTQNRMVFRNKDHREIIMEDQYHGAVYVGDDPKVAWRKYKPRLIFQRGAKIEYHSAIYPGYLYSIDTENKYFSKTLTDAFGNNYLFGNIYHKQNANLCLSSINGYDWKKKTTSTFFDINNYLGSYGNYELFQSGNYYDIYGMDYDEENFDFSGPTKVGSMYIDKTYRGQINNDLYQGGIFSTSSNYKLTIYLVTGLNFESQEIFSHTGTRINRCAVLGMFYVNKQYFIIIDYETYSRYPTYENGSYTIYHELRMLHSESGAPGAWIEEVIVPTHTYCYVSDNERNKITYNYRYNEPSFPVHMIYHDSKYYIYMENRDSYTSWENYTKRNNTKVIYGGGSDLVYEHLYIYYSSDLSSWTWTGTYPPDYIDVPFFNSEEIFTGRHGIGIMKPNVYSGIRFFLNGVSIRNDQPEASSNYLPNEQHPSHTLAYNVPGFFGPGSNSGTNKANRQYVNLIESINGKIQNIGDSENNDIWIFKYLTVYNDYDHPSGSNIIFTGLIAANFTDPLFRDNSECYVYLLVAPSDFAVGPDFDNNVDPISTEDYIFD